MMIIINVIGLILIIAIIWWFWLSEPKAVSQNEDIISIDIKDGVYSPSRIEVKNNHPVQLQFTRYDQSPCSEYIEFKELGIQHQIAFKQTLHIDLGKLNPGHYHFACQMNMYQGELIVKN